MSTTTGIAWTDHTLNPWWGCTKVHSGCANCYAESLDARWAQTSTHWGKDAPRRMVLGEWSKPAKWNREALATFGRPARVFCASMCDLFEDFDGPVVDQQDKPVEMKYHKGRFWTVPTLRARVFNIIEETPNLEWQLLTKRPENIRKMVPPAWLTDWPAHVLTGTSPCDQATADKSIPPLLAVPGRHFLSCEPLLGPIEFWPEMFGNTGDSWCNPRINWVIVGAESNGAKCGRFADGYADAARSIIDQCRAAGVPCFHKQMPIDGRISKEPTEWPDWARVQEFPNNPARPAEV